MSLLPEADREEASRFRDDVFDCLTSRGDELFELTDALLCADGPVMAPVDLTLVAEHRRGHGAMYDALNSGNIDLPRLRQVLAGLPMPQAADGRLVLAVDMSHWLRPDAPTSPDRLFCHVYGRGGRASDQFVPGWPYSFVALLVSEACNIGMTPVINPNYEALTRAQLVHVDQYYLRGDTIAATNAALIEAQARVPIVQFWGKGLLASVDGLRFVVPVRTINDGPSPKYFAKKKGITWLNAINDQVIGIGQMVVPGTPRDSLFILDALLNLDGGVKPEMVATDNASYSDMVFGIFKMLGYRFSPRFKDLEDQRFWKAQMPGAETAGGYGPLEALARNKVNVKQVLTAWPDMLRVAGSLVTNQVRAYDLLRMFGREGHPTPLVQAFAEYGRIAKTLHLLAARRQLHGAESCPSTPALIEMCDLLQGHVSEIRALLVALGMTDEDLQTLLSGATE